MPDLYGFTPTNAGRGLIASLLAGQTLTITRAMVGSGKPDSLEAMAGLTDLVAPVARATYTTPVRTGDAVSLTVEYRSDLDGGLQEGFSINEYGLFAKTADSAETLIFYGCLGDHPQWVSPAAPGVAPDIRDYPVTIVTSETKTVTTGLVTIAGPAADLGEKPMPFAFWFSCGVSDQTAVQDIAVRVTVDGREFFTGTLDSGAAKGLYIDTRFRAAGQHTIAVTASKEDYQPAAASYTFTVPSVTLPYEGRAEMPQNSAGQPVWWYGLARFIFGEDGKDLITLMEERP